MSQERSLIAFNHAREGTQRFEYFILGVSVALCAYVGQTLKPEKICISPYGLEVLSLVLLIASVIAGFKRIEAMICCERLHSDFLHRKEILGQLARVPPGQTFVNEGNGQSYSPEEAAKLKEQINKQELPRISEDKDDWSNTAASCYRWRNRFLSTGFVGLFLSKLLLPYFS